MTKAQAKKMGATHYSEKMKSYFAYGFCDQVFMILKNGKFTGYYATKPKDLKPL